MEKMFINAIGFVCPVPVVKAKNAVKELEAKGVPGVVEVLVDNEIAVQNLGKLAEQKNLEFTTEKLEEKKYRVLLGVGEVNGSLEESTPEPELPEGYVNCCKKNKVVVVSSCCMGAGDEKLGRTLIKAFLYALSEQEEMPDTILFYNSGIELTTEESKTIEDLKVMQEKGVEILSCGTCLNFYGKADNLKIGGVTNMYEIVEKMTKADLVVKPC